LQKSLGKTEEKINTLSFYKNHSARQKQKSGSKEEQLKAFIYQFKRANDEKSK